MKYDFNRLIQTTLPSNPNLSGQDAANYNLRILEFSNCYTSNMHCIKEDLKSFMREMKQTTQLKKFSFNQKKHLFEHIQKEGTSLQKGFCYLTGYGTKANIEEEKAKLAEQKAREKRMKNRLAEYEANASQYPSFSRPQSVTDEEICEVMEWFSSNERDTPSYNFGSVLDF